MIEILVIIVVAALFVAPMILVEFWPYRRPRRRP